MSIKVKILRIIRWSCRSPKLLNEPRVTLEHVALLRGSRVAQR